MLIVAGSPDPKTSVRVGSDRNPKNPKATLLTMAMIAMNLIELDFRSEKQVNTSEIMNGCEVVNNVSEVLLDR